MYKTYKIDETIKDCFVVGDLHGLFSLLKLKIKNSTISNAIIIVAGDCGLGFEKPQFYIDEYNKMKDILITKNVQIIFVRGNHDDKTFFDNEVISLPNFFAVPDYSIIEYTNFKGIIKHILCVGGAISIDRNWRKGQEFRYNKKYYWENEIPVYSPEILDEIKSDNILIDAVVTHTSPNFAPLLDKTGINEFILYDNMLSDDIDIERLTMTSIYYHLVRKDHHPVKYWIYGHFHNHMLYDTEDDVHFVMLNCFNSRSNTWDIFSLDS